MKKYILTFSLISTLLVAPFASNVAMAAIDMIEINDNTQASIDCRNRVVFVENAAGQQLRVFDVTGACVYKVDITNDSQKVDLPQNFKGVYIAKVGKTVKKIFVK